MTIPPTDPTDPTAPGFGGLAHRIGARNLKIAIVTMPIFFIVAVALIILVFGKRDNDATEGETDSAAIGESLASEDPATEEASPEAIMLSAGASPGAIALDGDRLAVRLDGPNGVEVVIYDIAKGAIVTRIPFAPRESDEPDQE